MSPSVATIILNYRSAGLAIRAVEAALKATERYAHAPIYLIDNDSGDGSFERLEEAKLEREWPERVHIQNSGRNGGYGFGNNVGFRLALATEPPPDYFYILNPDCFPDPDAVEELVDFFRRHPRAGIVGSAARGEDGNPHCTAFRFPSLQSEFEDGVRLGLVSRLLAPYRVPIGDEIEERIVDWVGGMSVLIRREVLDEIGFFDEGFFLYFEETDLCKRARAAGYDVGYAKRSRVVHIGSATTGLQSPDTPMPNFWYDSRRRYFEKNHGVAYRLLADFARLAGESAFRARVRTLGLNRPAKPHFIRDFLKHQLRSEATQLMQRVGKAPL